MSTEQLKALVRRAEHVVRTEDLEERLAEGRPLRVKLGVDPTARDITVGRALRRITAEQSPDRAGPGKDEERRQDE